MGGQFVSVTGTTITIRDDHGHVSTYPLSATAPITKILAGSVSDLAIGEMVRADLNSAGTCLDVMILDA